MKLTEEQLVASWEKILTIIEDTFSGDRKEKLLKLHKDFEDRFLFMPASYKDYYHSCYPGGYVQHVLNVINNTVALDKIWTEHGQEKNYTDEEMIFVALTHDIGKVGDVEHPYYEEHNDEWRKKRGELYKINDDLTFMSLTDRTFYLLNYYGITISQSEYIAIKLHDGLYEEGNEQYLKSYFENKRLRNNLPTILHQADMMAMSIERDKHYYEQSQPKTTSKKKTVKMSDDAKKVFDNFFEAGDKN